MPVKHSLVLLFLLFSASGYSGIVSDTLPNVREQTEYEKLYLHTDRHYYLAGEKIRLKAYILNGFLPDTLSTTLYVELLDKELKLQGRSIFPVFSGVAYGQLEIPSSLSKGSYILRAYTAQHIHAPDYHYLQEVKVYGNRPQDIPSVASAANILLQFFPEGGNFVNGMVNTVAFKATDSRGLPVKIKGLIKDVQGEIIGEAESFHDGMGKFLIRPFPGQQYYLELSDCEETFPLPQAENEGVVLTVSQIDRGIAFRLEQHPQTPSLKQAAFITGVIQGETIFRKPFSGIGESVTGIIPVKDLPTGIMKITVFNQHQQPLAERLVFIQNGEFKVETELYRKVIKPEPFQNIQLSVKIKEPVAGSFSISVTDADFDEDIRPVNIFSQFLLSSEIKGYIHHPSWYFSTAGDSTIMALDLVMLTNGWRRFRWVENQPEYSHPFSYIRLKGAIVDRYNKKPFAKETFFLHMTPAYDAVSGRGTIRIITTDEKGKFYLDSLIFPGKMSIEIFKFPQQKNMLSFNFDEDSLHMPSSVKEIPEWFKFSGEAVSAIDEKYASVQIYENAKLLETVTVKARGKTEKEKLDEIYTSGYFRGGAGTALDLSKETGPESIFDYIRNRITNLKVELSEEEETMGEYIIRFRQQNTDIWPNPPLQLYLNELPASSAFIEPIPVSQIAYVKLFPTFIGRPGGAGALAIYTRNFETGGPKEHAFITTYNGYSIVEEFYSPDYTGGPPIDKDSDERITLFWKPDIVLADIDPELPISFYNNSKTKRFKLVVEGITSEGKLLMLEEIIE
jgi:hypothetical protein